jgi:hypothetical protein
LKAVRPKAGAGEAVPVGALNELARLPVDVLSLTDVERTAFAHIYSPSMHALTGTVRHIRPHHVTSPKTANTLGTLAATARKPCLSNLVRPKEPRPIAAIANVRCCKFKGQPIPWSLQGCAVSLVQS